MKSHLLATLALSLALAAPAAVSAQEKAENRQNQQQQAQLSADAHHIIGKKAVSQQGKEAGEIKDVLIGQDGKVQALVADVKGKKRAIPWNDVAMSADQLTIKMNDDQLAQLPEYKGEKD